MDTNSSTIRNFSYDPETKELTVDFHGTGRYIYNGVPKEVYDGLSLASSKGSYLHKNIKGRFNYSRA